MNTELTAYIEAEIIPRYAHFDRAHGIDHVRTVIRQSMELAAHYDVRPEMVYTIAAYHDTGLDEGRERHHIRSGEIVASDPVLPRWFAPEQIVLMREAVEDHRASSEHAPRSLYGRIVAEADRCIDPDTTLRRTIRYGLDRYPELDRTGHLARCREHLHRKYAAGGYLRLWIPESDNAQRLEAFRALIRDEELFGARFDAIYRQETRSAADASRC